MELDNVVGDLAEGIATYARLKDFLLITKKLLIDRSGFKGTHDFL